MIFNKNFNFHSHISAICSSCIYHIRNLWRIRHHLDMDSAKWLVNALVSSRLDYCKLLLSGITETGSTKLQRILNRLARVVTKSPPFTRSVPLLRSLHWLPVKYRVHFKICLLTYKALHEEQPIYLRSLIGRITSRNRQIYHTMAVSEWHKIENDGDPWQPTCWLRMAHNDDDLGYLQYVS